MVIIILNIRSTTSIKNTVNSISTNGIMNIVDGKITDISNIINIARITNIHAFNIAYIHAKLMIT